jgi:hypothetical protein
MERMEEAFRILARLPVATRPRGYVNSMPYYLYDRGDLNAQMETYELERMARARNRVRIAPSPAEVARMEEAPRWPALFLSGAEFQHVARAVNLGSLWSAFDADIDAGLKRMKITGAPSTRASSRACASSPASSSVAASSSVDRGRRFAIHKISSRVITGDRPWIRETAPPAAPPGAKQKSARC